MLRYGLENPLIFGDLIDDWRFSYDRLVLSIRGSDEIKPRHVPLVSVAIGGFVE